MWRFQSDNLYTYFSVIWKIKILFTPFKPLITCSTLNILIYGYLKRPMRWTALLCSINKSRYATCWLEINSQICTEDKTGRFIKTQDRYGSFPMHLQLLKLRYSPYKGSLTLNSSSNRNANPSLTPSLTLPLILLTPKPHVQIAVIPSTVDNSFYKQTF
jgi:hypothetical protein